MKKIMRKIKGIFKGGKFVPWLIGGTIFILLLPMIKRQLRKLFAPDNTNGAAEDKTEKEYKDLFDAVDVNESACKLTSVEHKNRANIIYEQLNATGVLNYLTLGYYPGYDINKIEAQFYSKEFLMPQWPSYAGETFQYQGQTYSKWCTKDDVKAIYKEFGLRTFDTTNDGEPSSMTWLVGWLGSQSQIDMLGWMRKKFYDDAKAKINKVFQKTNSGFAI